MGHLLKLKCLHSRLNVNILASTSISFRHTTVRVPNVALTWHDTNNSVDWNNTPLSLKWVQKFHACTELPMHVCTEHRREEEHLSLTKHQFLSSTAPSSANINRNSYPPPISFLFASSLCILKMASDSCIQFADNSSWQDTNTKLTINNSWLSRIHGQFFVKLTRISIKLTV